MFRLLCVITCVSAGLPAQRSIVRDDGLRAPRDPEERPAEKVESLNQEVQEVQTSGSLATDSTKEGAVADNEVKSGSDGAASNPEDQNGGTTNGGTTNGGGDGEDPDVSQDPYGELFVKADELIAKIMKKINYLSKQARRQQENLKKHKTHIKDMRSKYNLLVVSMKNKMAQLRTNMLGMVAGLNKAGTATFSGNLPLILTENEPKEPNDGEPMAAGPGISTGNEAHTHIHLISKGKEGGEPGDGIDVEYNDGLPEQKEPEADVKPPEGGETPPPADQR